MMKAAQLMALAMRPIVVRSMPASRQPALVTELVIEWVMQMTVYATKSIIKFLSLIHIYNARNAEMVPVHIKEKRAYSVGDIMAMLDISRSSAYILIKKDFFRSHKIGNQIRISKVSFDEWLDGVSPTPRDI